MAENYEERDDDDDDEQGKIYFIFNINFMCYFWFSSFGTD